MRWRQRERDAGFSRAVRNFAGRTALPWGPCLGGRPGAAGRGAERTARALTPRPGVWSTRCLGPGRASAAPRSAGVGGSQFSRSGCRGGARALASRCRCPLHTFLLLPGRRRHARGSGYRCFCRSRAGREPPPDRGCSRGWGKAERIPLLSLGFPTLRGPRARSAAAAAARTTSGQRSLCHRLQLEEAAVALLAPGLERR